MVENPSPVPSFDSTCALPADLAPSLSQTTATPSRLTDFYELTKPRMNFLVVITTLVGFVVASGTSINWLLLCWTILGTTLCAACASVFNQLIERTYDGLMPRTIDRPLPAGRLMPREAAVFGTILGVAGAISLLLLVNPLTAALGVITICWYLFLYTPAKRFTPWNTMIGAVPGAIPPAMGFAAAQGTLSYGAAAVFGILFLWQIPHFLAIAIMYRDDYIAGGFKMLPCIETDFRRTSRHMVVCAALLLPVSLIPWALHIVGNAYLITAIVLGAVFLWTAILTAKSRTRTDARRLFFCSIIYLPLVLAVMTLNR